ncbi:MAG: hypothetical protein H6622_03645 [Halobacteriovoraceae bacterium]|nr:hypothetical protein [Halobacteriovoraceae bacterium]
MHILKLAFIFLIIPDIFAQSIIESLDSSSNIVTQETELPEESIFSIDGDKRIFILTHDSEGFSSGDYISLVLNKELVARALCAKIFNNKAGIKILKIYNTELWDKLRRGTRIKILRGDDSYYRSKPQVAEEANKEEEKEIKDILSKEDLYDDINFLEDDIGLDDNKNRVVKNDNLIYGGIAYFSSINATNTAESIMIFTGSWSYQLTDNTFIEAQVARGIHRDTPLVDIDTIIFSYSGRIKYTVEAPFHFILQPYFGYRVVVASANYEENATTTAELNTAADILNSIEKKDIIFGASVLRRLVPGWYVRGDVGIDMISAGLTLEF